MIKQTLLIVGILSFLFGCKNSNTYHKQKGDWYYDDRLISKEDAEGLEPLNSRFAKSARYAFYRGEIIEDSDPSTFQALDDHYSKDKKWVYYCDTYRKGQEYFITKYNSVVAINYADPASFRLDSGSYARDKSHMFYEGKMFPVKDVNSFEVLEGNYAKDKFRGYYLQTEIEGSEGKTFQYLERHFSKDANNIYYSDNNGGEDKPVLSNSLPGADPSTFKIMQDDYSMDAKHVYHRSSMLTNDVQTFQGLRSGYAKTSTQVFYWGTRVSGADPSTFTVNETSTDSADATDRLSVYFRGVKVN